jgi:hypothetical protein
MLSEEMKEYISNLKSRLRSISSVWLLGSRANGTANSESDWDFLVFSDTPIFDEIKNDPSFHRDDIDLLLVAQNGAFSKPFGQPKGGTLEKWKWQRVSSEKAQYEGSRWVPDLESAKEGFDNMGDLVCETLNAYRV